MVRKTKTISFGERVLRIPFTIVPNSIFCLHYYVILLLRCVKYQSSDDQLVCYMNRERLVRGSYSWLSKWLTYSCGVLGLDALNTHSLRRGGDSPCQRPTWICLKSETLETGKVWPCCYTWSGQ